MSVLDLSPQKKRNALVTTDVVVEESSERDVALVEARLAGEAVLGVAPLELVSELVSNLTAAAKAAEKSVAAFGASISGLAGTIAEAGLSLNELAALIELEEYEYDAAKHPRWPAGTPGGLGGKFMKVGQRFKWKGVEYDVAAVMPGHIWANVATKGAPKAGKPPPATIEIQADKLEGGNPVISGVTRPPAEAVRAVGGSAGGKLMGDPTKFTGTIIDPYVHPETHDASIPLPPASKLTEEEWKRFGKLDQERYWQVMEKLGPYAPAKAQTLLNGVLSKADPTTKALLSSAQKGQEGSSSGTTLSLYNVYGDVLGMTPGTPSVEAARAKYEAARDLQDDIGAVLQWDIYNRIHAPDILLNHRHGTHGFMQGQIVQGDLPVFPGLSQSGLWTPTHNTGIGGGSDTFFTPMGVRHIVMALEIANISGVSYPNEREFANAEAYAADDRSVEVRLGDLSQMQQKWLTKITKSGVAPGYVAEALKESMADAGASLPVPPADPILQMDKTGKETYVTPPKVATVGVGGFKYADVDDDGVPIAKPAKELNLKPGDYIEGMKGTRYLIVSAPSYPFGVAYFKVTDIGTKVGPAKPYTGEIHDQSTANQAFVMHPDWNGSPEAYQFGGSEPGLLPFKKLAAHYKLPVETAEFKSDFHPEAWTFSPESDAKLLAKFDPGQMLELNGTFFKVTDQLGGGWTRVQSLTTGEYGKLNSDYKSTFLILKAGYSEGGQAQLDPGDYFKGDHTNIGDGWDSLEAGSIVQVGQTLWKVEQKTDGGEVEMSQASGASANIGKLHTFGPTQIYVPMTQKPPGWEPPEIGDTVAVEGKKGTVTKILKNGDVQLNLAPGVLKVKPSDPLLAGLYSPAKWSVGDKTKLKQIPDGAPFHGGTGAKVKPYMVLSHEGGGKVLVKNLDTGEQTSVSGNKSYAALLPKQNLATAPATEATEPPAQVEPPQDLVDQFDPEKWEAGPSKSLADLIPGDVVVLSGKPYKVDAFTGAGDDQVELKNLTTGGVFAFSKTGATLSGITTMPTLQAKGIGEQFPQHSASPVGPVPVLPSELHVGDVIDTNPLKPGSYTYEVLATKATPTGAALTLKGVGTEDGETYIDQDWVDEKIAEKHSWTLVSSKQAPPSSDLPTPLEDGETFNPDDWENWAGTPYTPMSVFMGMTTKPQPGTVFKSHTAWYAVTSTTPDHISVKQIEPVGPAVPPGSFTLDPSALVAVMTKKQDSFAPNLATSYEDVSGDVVSPHDVPVGTLLAVKGLGGEDAVVWKTTGKQGGLGAVLVATPDGLPETTLDPNGVAIGDTWHLVGDKSFVKVALKGAPPPPVEPDFAPVYATSFDPSVYTTLVTEKTLGDLDPGQVFQGKSGAYMQVKKASGANVYATNLSTGKATKLSAKIHPAFLLEKPPEVAYEDLKPGSPVLLGDLKPGDQYLTKDSGGVTHLMQVLEAAPSVSPNDETMQVKTAAVFENGSLGTPQLAGNSSLNLVMFKAFAKDVPPVVPDSVMPPPLNIDVLPVLKVGAATGKDWLINPYLHPHSGKNVYTKIKEMPPGAVFHDKDGQHFKVVSGPGEQMAVLSGGTGTAYQVNGNLRGKFVEPADVPMEAKAVFDAADVDVPDTLPDQTYAKLVAPKMKANSGQNIASLALGAGDWVQGLAGSKFSKKPMQITESGGEVAGKPTWWKAVDAEGHPTTLSMTAVPTKYWKATDLLSPVAPTGPDAFFDSLANGDKAAYVGPHNHPSNPPMSVTVTDNQIVGGGIQVKSDTSGAEFQAFKGELSPSAQTTATPVGSPDLTAGWPPVDYTVVGQVPVAELSTGDVFKSQTNDTVLKVTGEDDDGVWVLDVTKTVGAIHMASSDWGDTQVTLLKPSGATTAVNKVTKEPLDFDSLDGFTHNPEGVVGELGPGAYFTAPQATKTAPHTIWQVTGPADSSGNVPVKVVWSPASPNAVGKDSSVKKTQAVGYSAAAELPADPNAFDLGDFTPNEIGVTLGMLKPGDQFSDGPHNFVFELLPTASSEPGKVSVKTLWPQVTAGQVGVHSAEFVPALVKQAASTPKPSSASPSSSLGDYTEGETVTLGDLTPGTIFKSLSASVFQVTGEGKAKNLKTGAEIAHLLPSMPATPLYPKDEAVPPTLSAGVPSFAQIKAGLAPGWVPNTETLKTLKLKQGDMFTGSGVKGPGGVGAEDGVFHVVGAGTSTGAGIDAKVLIPHSIPNASEAGTVSGFSDGFTPAFVWHSGDLPPAGSAPSLPVAPAVTLGTPGSDMQFGEVQTGEWFVDDMGDTWKKVGPFTGLLMKPANSPASAPVNHEETFSSEDEVTMIEKPRPQVGDKLPFGELPVGTKFKMIDNDGDPSGPEHEKTADYEFTNTVTGDVGTMPEHGLNVFYEVTGVPGGSQPAQATATPTGPVVHDQDGNVIEPDDTVVALDGKSHEVASISPTGGVVFKEGGAVYPSTVKVTKKGSAGDSSGIDFAGKTGFTPNDDTPLSDMPVGTYFSIGGDYGVWQTTGPPVGGKIPQKLVWSAIAANAGETGEVPETYVPAWTHPPEGALLGPSEPNSAGFQTGQKINVVSPGGTWSHVEVLDTNLGGVKVKLPNIDIPQIIPNDWAHADPLVAGSPGGAPMKAKVGDEVQFKSPTTAESTYPAEITQLGPALATLKYEDGSTTQIPKGWISKIVKTSFGDGSTGEPSQLVGLAGVHVGDVISPPPEPVALDANGNVVQAADPPHWEVTDSGLATVGLKLVKQPTINGKPIESSLSLDTPHTIEVKDAAAWTMIQQAPAPSGKKQSMYELAPGKLFFSQDLAGVPAGTYQKLPAGMEKLYPATDVDPGEGHDDIWIRNVGDGKVYWTGGSLEVQPMGNVTPPVKGYDFDPSGYEDGLPDTTLDMLVKSPGTIVMVGTDHYMINRADEDGGAGVTQLTGSDAGKTKTFGPDTVAVVQVTKKGGSAASASQAASGEFVSDYDEGTSLIPDLWDKTKSTISAGAAAGPDPLVLLPPGTVVRSGTGTFYEIQGTTTAPDTGEPTMLVKAISTTLGGEGLSEYEPPFPILPSAVLTVMKPQKWSSSSGSFESHPDALPATKEWAEFPVGSDAWTLGGKHAKVTASGITLDDGTTLTPSSPLYVSDPLATPEPTNQIAAGYAVPGDEVEWDYGQWHLKGTVTKKTESGHLTVKLIDPPDSFTGGQVAGNFGIPPTQMLTSITPKAKVAAEDTVGNVPKGSIVTLSGGKPLVVGDTVVDKMDGSVQVRLLDPENWPQLYTVAPVSEAVGSVKLHPVAGYQYAHSGKKKFPKVGELPVGARFHGKSKEVWEVAETPKDGVVKVWRTEMESGGTTLTTTFLPWDLRVFHLG